MGKELISIIIPVYNVEHYLDKCLESVINQTYKNIEIILINDGSTDDSLSILEKYKKVDKRVKVINKKNGGVSSARNAGLDICKGKYITFIDSDDYVDTDYVEILYKKAKKYDVDIVFSNAIEVFKNGNTKNDKKIIKDILLDKEKTYKNLFSEKNIKTACWGNLYKADIIKDIRFDTNLHIAEDFKFLVDVISNINNSVMIPDRKYYYYVRENSLFHSIFNEDKIIKSICSEKWYGEINYSKELVNKFMDTNLEKYAVRRYVRLIVTYMYALKIAKEEYRELKKLIKPYFLKYLFSDIVSLKLKVMYLYVLLKY